MPIKKWSLKFSHTIDSGMQTATDGWRPHWHTNKIKSFFDLSNQIEEQSYSFDIDFIALIYSIFIIHFDCCPGIHNNLLLRFTTYDALKLIAIKTFIIIIICTLYYTSFFRFHCANHDWRALDSSTSHSYATQWHTRQFAMHTNAIHRYIIFIVMSQ